MRLQGERKLKPGWRGDSEEEVCQERGAVLLGYTAEGTVDRNLHEWVPLELCKAAELGGRGHPGRGIIGSKGTPR